MYFTAMEGDWKHRSRAYPNYLYAIAEWELQRRIEPPEITAERIRQFYQDPSQFLDDLRATLYAGGSFYTSGERLQAANPVLASVSSLCRRSQPGGAGVTAVVSYNYDNLLEMATEGSGCRFVPVWKSSTPLAETERPIFHVHGFIPMMGRTSEPDSIVFTESQYHAAANDLYSWSNLCQIQCMSSTVGLMVGLSLTDSNMRRLLNALKTTPMRKRSFALLKKPSWATPRADELDAIHEKARQYAERFDRSGVKADFSRNPEMLQIIDAVNQSEQAIHGRMLDELGITPIWFESFEDVPCILNSILER
jgi:hypothetical protein